VTAAIAEFMEVGITKATMDKIAKRANLAKGTLYLHFASKEELLVGTLEFAFSQTSLINFGAPRLPGERMQSYLERLFLPSMERFGQSARADIARLVLGEAKSYPALGQFYYERIFGPWHTHVEALFAQALQEGELQGIAPATAAMLMGSPFWVFLAADSIHAPVKPGCSAAELTRAQIAALFGAYGAPAAAAPAAR
jgi:TetR/AcrR family transcriptional regulator of autoinduction and epiphytic fitness